MVGKGKRKIEAIGYMRTSSATNVGRDKDSEARQRAAIESYAKAAGYTIIDWRRSTRPGPPATGGVSGPH
jgi:DNA invertase Pin-like site-specific DNA recombinase